MHNSPASLQIGVHTIDYAAIRQGVFPEGIMDSEKQTLTFCQQWLKGQEIFTMLTSGSTGPPKALTFHRHQMVASAHMTGKALGLAAGDRALVSLPTQYIGGRMMLVRGFELNLHITIVSPASLPLSSFASDVQFDFLSFVPLQLQNTLRQTPEKLAILNRAKAILLGGAPVNASLEAQLQAIQAPVYHTYGMTETISHIALRKLNTPASQMYFTVLEGISIATDVRGCLVIHAPFLHDQAVVTNDVVRLLSPTAFEWIGRIDNVINTGGIKVQAEKVEKAVDQVFHKLGTQKRFFVASLPDTLLGEAVTLFIETSPFTEEEENKLKADLDTHLTKYEKPKLIKYLPAFAETASGKLDKRQSIARLPS